MNTSIRAAYRRGQRAAFLLVSIVGVGVVYVRWGDRWYVVLLSTLAVGVLSREAAALDWEQFKAEIDE